MKKLVITLSVVALFICTGCADRNAFKEFHISKRQELSEDTILTVKLNDQKETAGIVTVVYLNKIYPKKYHDKEYFYIYYYLKEKSSKLIFLLNNKKPLEVDELPRQNPFATLTSFNAPWSKYKLVAFQKEGNILKLKIKTAKAAEATLTFIKDK